ncbi:MAG: chorismate synthase [Actinobacteria bacterium]|nr:chorismate synthase [Actinomycetota bacterium]
MRFLDSGESHGAGMLAVVEGMPMGVPVRREFLESELARRRLGYGRGPRMALERDEVEILGGVRGGRTLGSPVALLVRNAEHRKWLKVMSPYGEVEAEPLTRPRPGHADLAGAIKYGTRDIRDILERSSARETVGRVCAGALAKSLLVCLDIHVYSHVLQVGEARVTAAGETPRREEAAAADEDPMRCLDREASLRMREEVDRARREGDSLGGVFEVVAYGVPPGLGSHVHWDRRLDGRLAAAVMSIQAVKGVEVGEGFLLAGMRGSLASDPIYHSKRRGFYRRTNRAGGLEGGITNGEPVVVRAAMKPIPTLASPLETVDLVTKERVAAAVERADVCAVPAAAVIAESAVAFVLADALLEKLGGDSLEELGARFRDLKRRYKAF